MYDSIKNNIDKVFENATIPENNNGNEKDMFSSEVTIHDNNNVSYFYADVKGTEEHLKDILGIQEEFTGYNGMLAYNVLGCIVQEFSIRERNNELLFKDVPKDLQHLYVPFTATDFLNESGYTSRRKATEFKNAMNFLERVIIEVGYFDKSDNEIKPVRTHIGVVWRSKTNRIKGFRLDDVYENYLRNTPIMFVLRARMKIHNSVARCELDKLTEHYNTNVYKKSEEQKILKDKDNSNKLTVIKLYEDLNGVIPRIEDLKNIRDAKIRIMIPMCDGLKELAEKGIIKYHFYKYRRGKEDISYTPEEVEKMTFNEFFKLRIYFELIDFPDDLQKNRIEKAEERNKDSEKEN